MYTFVPLTSRAYAKIPKDARPQLVEDTQGVVALNGDEIHAVAIMDSWTKNSCRIHVTVFNPFALKHGFQEEVFNFIFNTAGRKVIIGATPSDNKKALKFNAHMGFEELCRIENASEDGVDIIVTELRKENCKWIEQEVADGWQISRRA